MIKKIISKPASSLRAYFSIQKKLFVNDQPESYTTRLGRSGIRATIFGGTGLTGRYIGGRLGGIGSDLIYPYNTDHNPHHSDEIKMLKITANTGRFHMNPDMNFKDQNMIERMIGNSNVVINLVGPRKKLKRREEFQFVNIEVAERIATACKKKGVHRLIHFSAAGADMSSPSMDFQTKAIAQESIKKIFPNVTIFRPCPIYGLNDSFASIIQRQHIFFFGKFVIVSDDCTALKQPVFVMDIAEAVINALKLENSKGRTYELGGPHVLPYIEIYQIIFNYLKMKTRLAYVDPKILKFLTNYLYNWEFLSRELIIKRTIDEVVKKSQKIFTFEDLYVKPVAFKNGIQDMFRDRVATFNVTEEEYMS